MSFVDMDWHPAAKLMPLMGDAELRELADDIRTSGLRTPIVLLAGSILDGRNRHRACQLAGVEPQFAYVTSLEIGDPFTYVASLNLHRRHLSESQRAMVGAKLKEHFAAQAKERQLSSLKQNADAVTPNLGERSKGEAADQAAAIVNVSRGSVESAARVLAKGAPELVEAVERGEVAVSAAAEVARMPVEAQRAAVAEGVVPVVAKATREARKAKRHEADEDDFAEQGDLPVERFEFTAPPPAPVEAPRALDLGRLAPVEMDWLSREGKYVELARTFRERLAALIASDPLADFPPPRRERVYGELHRTLIDVAKALPESEQKTSATRWSPVVVTGGKS